MTIAVHGGAGTVARAELTPEQELDYRTGIGAALEAGYTVLQRGGTALDAVVEAVIQLEDNPLFNAGRGAVFTAGGTHELDAAVMDGTTRQAGAVAGIRGARNPIRLARTVLEKSENVLLLGAGAEAFAREHGLEFAPDAYFFTETRHREWQEARQEESRNVGKGTVGAVALDARGHLAAATSTGGIKNKKYGRVGDTPVIGGGTYANDRACAVSCTGDGEYFIRAVTAYDVYCLLEYRGLSLAEACRIAIHETLTGLGGEGGLIAVDRAGNAELVFNSEGMYRGWRNDRGKGEIAIF